MEEEVNTNKKEVRKSLGSNSKLIELLGPEAAGPKAMLLLGSLVNDRDAVVKANRSLEKMRRKSSLSIRQSNTKESSEL